MSKRNGGFVWYELMTSDLESAAAFYAKVLGWDITDFGRPEMPYRIAAVGEARVGGLMPIPAEAASTGLKPNWVGYIAVPDVDAHAQKLKEAGGTIHRGPADIPGVGRFAVVADPQGAIFHLFRGEGTPPVPVPYMTVGTVGWHELHAKDWEQVYPFYDGLFGWPKDRTMDMGPMGTYQLLGYDGVDFGAMFSNAEAATPFWLYYVSVDDIDDVQVRVADAGGTVTSGPHEVPGPMWIVHVSDPQGARFACVGPRKAASKES